MPERSLIRPDIGDALCWSYSGRALVDSRFTSRAAVARQPSLIKASYLLARKEERRAYVVVARKKARAKWGFGFSPSCGGRIPPLSDDGSKARVRPATTATVRAADRQPRTHTCFAKASLHLA
ncbi:hypothetical protein HPB50_003133 [Hyalomma asiaticum]|uniref:Uncharacterized protein n=1 Tax=Hyalomma asiaticum TaxID=266040 RepID=A0ACB7SK11_HYAAI|nr:hypothetical protein HPB50_003133 [Hyalomma asiaticum]